MQRIFAILLSVLLALPLLAEPADTFAIAIRSRIDTLLTDPMFERSNVGLYVYDLTADAPLYEHGKRQTLRPASNMKIMTAASALTLLGTDYNFQTRLYVNGVTDLPQRKAEEPDSLATDSTAEASVAHSARIYVKGGMDPLLGPDDLRAFAQALRDRGITAIKSNIVCDATFKDTVSMGWGWCWDDEYVPLTPFLYLGEANTFEKHFRKALKNAGIVFSGQFVHGRVPSGATLACTRVHSIDQILQPMMKQSNNLYAECLFYQLAAKGGKVDASRKDAAAQVSQFIKLVGHSPSLYQIGDGSGLSLYNYLSAELLVDVLRFVYRSDETYAHLNASLPIMGRDGTLKSRCKGTSAQDRVRAKTGTVRGVSSLSGYALAPNGHQLAFSIINQGITEAKQGRGFQDRVCRALTRPLGQNSVEPDSIPEEPDSAEEMPAPDDSTPSSSNAEGTSTVSDGSGTSGESPVANGDDAIAHDDDAASTEAETAVRRTGSMSDAHPDESAPAVRPDEVKADRETGSLNSVDGDSVEQVSNIAEAAAAGAENAAASAEEVVKKEKLRRRQRKAKGDKAE